MCIKRHNFSLNSNNSFKIPTFCRKKLLQIKFPHLCHHGCRKFQDSRYGSWDLQILIFLVPNVSPDSCPGNKIEAAGLTIQPAFLHRSGFIHFHFYFEEFYGSGKTGMYKRDKENSEPCGIQSRCGLRISGLEINHCANKATDVIMGETCR